MFKSVHCHREKSSCKPVVVDLHYQGAREYWLPVFYEADKPPFKW